jgi:hypothetical protein
MILTAVNALSACAIGYGLTRLVCKPEERLATAALIGILSTVSIIAAQYFDNYAEKCILSWTAQKDAQDLMHSWAQSILLSGIVAAFSGAYFAAKQLNFLIPSYIESFGLFWFCLLGSQATTALFSYGAHRLGIDFI